METEMDPGFSEIESGRNDERVGQDNIANSETHRQRDLNRRAHVGVMRSRQAAANRRGTRGTCGGMSTASIE